MKICIICCYYAGGFKSFVDNLVCILNRNRCEITMMFLNNDEQCTNGADKKIYINFDELPKRKKKQNKLLFIFLFLKKCIKKLLSTFNKNNRKIILKYSVFGSQYISTHKVLELDYFIDLSDYQCVISSEEIICNYFLANNVIAKKKIGYVHPDYLMAHFDKTIDKHFFKSLDYICAVSESNAKSLIAAFPEFKNKIRGIRNPIDVRCVLKKANNGFLEDFDKDIVNIITVCRLDNASKALDRLVELAKSLKNDGLKFVWRIIGDGPYKNSLTSSIKENGLDNEVKMLGFMSNPLPYVKHSDLFVLQSYYEGYPMSVCESLIVNTPVLITDFPSSKELVENEKTSFIVKNDFNSIYNKLRQLLKNKTIIYKVKEELTRNDKKQFESIDILLKLIKE